MQYNKPLLTWLVAAIMTIFLSGCSSWVYRINVPQGNFLEQSDVDKLRIEMTKEQVMFVLGTPVAKDAFNSSKWHYKYVFNIDRESEIRKSLIVHFENDKLVKLTGDFEIPAEFNTPLNN
ncbi:outer membrane protein assembly factor BamE [Pseudoalteromonas luteoviolacea]|uniref:Outer membrane protein assembly factor BamE n=1 Tax=Pseudoalteromonas luteoviolacea S4054 TaxID=1129367 RepID=A0A0F6AH50_9GAMM|nr:outer membrane protein assembly factor BamE [Pseudoalteromonas luteoviolacea]AOT09179.1 cell envelope protein SmpA [Pseudoalteromonas luteoviolacea]AOT14091.1 cell envelope protein SmpA [Pseudoalteromonas luteoviolacea]AOT19007.1 cell envelope protein SmpA [Pseudoalteromonas luteoviolacea]KKE85121.1 membrane protein [Pseudoalteromonas luteoviolacea S4054]KZN70239.1 membrane protein [Pseudoalteromonas luteoviolacea S4047-1]